MVHNGIIYKEEPQVKISNKIIFLSLKIISVSASSVDPEEMSHYMTFHLRSLLLAKVRIKSRWYSKG